MRRAVLLQGMSLRTSFTPSGSQPLPYLLLPIVAVAAVAALRTGSPARGSAAPAPPSSSLPAPAAPAAFSSCPSPAVSSRPSLLAAWSRKLSLAPS